MKWNNVLSWAVVCLTMTCMLGGCASGSGGWGSSNDYPPELPREFRGMWVATVANIDWPSKQGLSPEQMRDEMNRQLDTASRLNLNAIFLQVRPSCDAIYPSTLEPWSEFLTGEQGRAPGADGTTYDPLAEWIVAAHARGIELHAWFNPFRARHTAAKSPNTPTHISSKRPELVKAYDGYLWLDPGEPDARRHSLDVIMDVVSRYDIDGVHFDDYFYPYPKKDQPFPDDPAFTRFTQSGGSLERDEWRRENINTFVQDVYREVKRSKPWIRVGISPFGIWRPNHPQGVKGFDAFASLHADSARWLEEGWVDYLAPQLYWKIDSPQPYDDLLAWWLSRVSASRPRHVLVGNYTSRITAKPDDAKSWESTEILNQVTRTRERAMDGAGGNIHFSAVALIQNRRGVADALAQGPYAVPAVPPAMTWSSRGSAPARPVVRAEPGSGTTRLTWEPGSRFFSGRPAEARVWVVWARYGRQWTLLTLSGPTATTEIATEGPSGSLERIALQGVDRFGRAGALTMLEIARPMAQAAK